MSTMETGYLDRLLDPLTGCLTREVAARLLALRPDEAVTARIEELANKANEGTWN